MHNRAMKQTNWQDVILLLRIRGHTQADIARMTGTTQSVISDIAAGKTRDPRYSTGRKLLNLARRKK